MMKSMTQHDCTTEAIWFTRTFRYTRHYSICPCLWWKHVVEEISLMRAAWDGRELEIFRLVCRVKIRRKKISNVSSDDKWIISAAYNTNSANACVYRRNMLHFYKCKHFIRQIIDKEISGIDAALDDIIVQYIWDIENDMLLRSARSWGASRRHSFSPPTKRDIGFTSINTHQTI